MNSAHDGLEALARLVAEAKSARDGGIAKMPSDPDRAIPVLRDHLARWDAPCPFDKGDVITVAPHSTIWNKTAGFVIVRSVFPAQRRRDDDHMVYSYDMSILLVENNGIAREFDAHSRDFILHEKAAS